MNSSKRLARRHLDVGHPDNPKAFPICGAKTRQEQSNPVCLQPAGWGTNHPGSGGCKLPGHGQNYKEGSPSWLWHWADKIRRSHPDVRGPFDMGPELEAKRMLFDQA